MKTAAVAVDLLPMRLGEMEQKSVTGGFPFLHSSVRLSVHHQKGKKEGQKWNRMAHHVRAILSG